MLTSEGCSARRQRLWRSLPKPCDVLILSDPAHLTYFANHAPSIFEFRHVEAAALLVLERDPARSTLIGDNILRADLDSAHVDAVHAPVWYQGQASAAHRKARLVEVALEFLKPLAARRIGIEMATAPAGLIRGLESSAPGIEWLDLDPLIRPLRRSKDVDELALLRRCLKASDAGMAAAMSDLRPGMTEFDAYMIVQGAASQAAGAPVQLYGDFVSGPRCEQIGGAPSGRVLAAGDLVLLDYSVVIHGYRGDIANTFRVGGGAASAAQRALHEKCLDAIAAGEALLKPNVACKDVDAAVRRVLLKDGGKPEHFPGHAGHGVGLGHPEPPYIVPESVDTLMVGDVVTLEPGQYVPGVAGMRFERNYVITESGFETLSGHPLSLEA